MGRGIVSGVKVVGVSREFGSKSVNLFNEGSDISSFFSSMNFIFFDIN